MDGTDYVNSSSLSFVVTKNLFICFVERFVLINSPKISPRFKVNNKKYAKTQIKADLNNEYS